MFDHGYRDGFQDYADGFPYFPAMWVPRDGWERGAYLSGYATGWNAAKAQHADNRVVFA